MKSWAEFLPFLYKELDQLAREELTLSAEEVLQVLKNRGSDEGDAAVREYASTLVWPPLEDRLRFEICLRLRVAIWWTETVADADPEGTELQALLEDTMIGYWRDEGKEDWIYNHLVDPDVVI